ncbi:histone-lysine N-methyltransferase SETMAR [Trichonephila inaurata madagascariensis]|uniref:Histone-lysine N-methyltransferase SETMAR n=1 Tax=Trichonephila inaurata madagascariensis TaxID=2747483 RepID=A0A8X6XTD4_9ARAC|nr:histone-lysine N-methyltransferase SETMAR [Trichonephila inaurata madagascariensis]
MDVSKELVQGCFLYDFKVGLSAAASNLRICQAFGDCTVEEHDEGLQAAIEEDSSQTCCELARQFNTSSETVRLHLHHLGKTYRLSKWVPQTLLEIHKQQRVAACLSLLSRHRSASIFSRVLTIDEKWVLNDTPKRSKYWLSPQDTVPYSARPPIHPLQIMLCIWWTCRQVVHYELLPTGQTVTADLYS